MTTNEMQLEGSAFARFMASKYGRMIRATMGVTLITAGLFVIEPPLGFAVATFGLLPLATGIFNLCPVAPIWGGHFLGVKYCGIRTPKQ